MRRVCEDVDGFSSGTAAVCPPFELESEEAEELSFRES